MPPELTPVDPPVEATPAAPGAGTALVGPVRETPVVRPVAREGPLAADVVLAALLADLAPRSQRTYREHYRLAGRFFGVAPEALPALLLGGGQGRCRHLVETYREHVKARGGSNGYVNLAVSALQALVRKAEALGLVDWTVRVKRLKVRKPDMRGPGVPAIRLLLAAAAADRNPKRAARDAALIRLLYDRAARLAEALSVDVAHVELGPQGIPVAVRVLAKGGDGEHERLTIPPQTGLALAHWLAVRGDAPGPVFCSLDRRCRGAVRRLTGRAVEKRLAQLAAGLVAAGALPQGVKARPHGLRHSAATQAMLDGIPIPSVQRFTRHASPPMLS